jgi:hypothetical protein
MADLYLKRRQADDLHHFGANALEPGEKSLVEQREQHNRGRFAALTQTRLHDLQRIGEQRRHRFRERRQREIVERIQPARFRRAPRLFQLFIGRKLCRVVDLSIVVVIEYLISRIQQVYLNGWVRDQQQRCAKSAPQRRHT